MQTHSILSRIDFIEGTITEVERVLAGQKQELAELRSMVYSQITICGNSECKLCDPTCARQVLCGLSSCPRMAQLMENRAQQEQRSMLSAHGTGGPGAPASVGEPNSHMFAAPESLANRLERMQGQFPHVAQTIRAGRTREQELDRVNEERIEQGPFEMERIQKEHLLSRREPAEQKPAEQERAELERSEKERIERERVEREHAEREHAERERAQQQQASRGMENLETSWPPADLIMDLENAPTSVKSLAVALLNGFRLVTTDISRAKIGYRAAPGGHEVESFCPTVGVNRVFVGYNNSSFSHQILRPAVQPEAPDIEAAKLNRLALTDFQGFRDRVYAGIKRDAGKK